MHYTHNIALLTASLLLSSLAYAQTNEPAGRDPAETQSLNPSRRDVPNKLKNVPTLPKVEEYRQSDNSQPQSYQNGQQPGNGNRYGNTQPPTTSDRYNQPGYDQRGYDQRGYGQPGYNQRDNGYGNDRYNNGYGNDRYGNSNGNDWRNRNWDGYGDNNYRSDHEFWRGRWRDELGLSRGQRRELERIDDYYDRFRIDQRDPRFRQMQRQKFGDMLSVMTPQQRSIVLSRVQPPRGQYGRGNGQPGYGQPGYNPNRRSGSYGPYGGR